MAVILHYQKPSQYSDEFTSVGELSTSHAIEYFVQFPFEEEVKSIEEGEFNVTYPTLIYTTELDVTVRVQMKSLGEYLLEARKDNSIIECFFNRDFDSDPKIAAGQLLHDVLTDSSSLEWNSAIEENIRVGVEKKAFPTTFEHTAKAFDFLISEDLFLLLACILMVIGIWMWILPILFFGLLLLLIPLPIHLKQWHFHKFSEGVTVEIQKEKKSFLHKNKDRSKLIHREQIDKCTLIVDTVRKQTWIELKIRLKDGDIIRINEWLMDPTILIEELGLKYRVLK